MFAKGECASGAGERVKMFFVVKVLISGVIVALASWLAGRKPVLAGFIVAIPIISILSIFWSYLEYRDMAKINQFAVTILVAVPISLSFFVPFVLNRWLKFGFLPTMVFALGLLALIYYVSSSIIERG